MDEKHIFDAWLGNKSDRTKRTYVNLLRRFLKFCGIRSAEEFLEILKDGKIDIAEKLREWKVDFKGRSGAPYIIGLSVVKSFIRECPGIPTDMRKKYLDDLEMIRTKGLRKYTEFDEPLTKEFIADILQSVDLYRKVIVGILATSGLRPSTLN